MQREVLNWHGGEDVRGEEKSEKCQEMGLGTITLWDVNEIEHHQNGISMGNMLGLGGTLNFQTNPCGII